ncbi:uncharacterized protein LOC144931748 [Lampetra fluviatilis]
MPYYIPSYQKELPYNQFRWGSAERWRVRSVSKWLSASSGRWSASPILGWSSYSPRIWSERIREWPWRWTRGWYGQFHSTRSGLETYDPSLGAWSAARRRLSVTLDSPNKYILSPSREYCVGSAIRTRHHKTYMFPGYSGTLHSLAATKSNICALRRKDCWLSSCASRPSWDM